MGLTTHANDATVSLHTREVGNGMTTTHKLKIWPRMFEAVQRGDKTFEIRKNDRDYQTGDTLVLEEWDPAKGVVPPSAAPWAQPAVVPVYTPPQPEPDRGPGYTGRAVTVRVTYTFHGGQFGVQGDYVVMAIERIMRSEEYVGGDLLPNCRCLLMPRWETAMDARSRGEPIPKRRYWDIENNVFRNLEGEIMPGAFRDAWFQRKDEFPEWRRGA